MEVVMCGRRRLRLETRYIAHVCARIKAHLPPLLICLVIALVLVKRGEYIYARVSRTTVGLGRDGQGDTSVARVPQEGVGDFRNGEIFRRADSGLDDDPDDLEESREDYKVIQKQQQQQLKPPQQKPKRQPKQQQQQQQQQQQKQQQQEPRQKQPRKKQQQQPKQKQASQQQQQQQQSMKQQQQHGPLVSTDASPSRHIPCFENLTTSYHREIESIRAMFKRTQDFSTEFTIPEADDSRPVLEASNERYFIELKKHSNIKTVLFNASLGNVENCLLSAYYPKYTINNCYKVISKAKRHAQYNESLYGMTCGGDPRSSLESSRLNPAAFDVGMPQGYRQGRNVKTVSYMHVVKHAIVTMYGDVVTSDVYVVPHRCHTNRLASINVKNVRTVDEVFTIAQYYGDGMYHSNAESVNRLALYIPFLLKNPKIKIHLYGKTPLFMSIFYFPKTRFVRGTVKAKIVYLPSGVSCCLPNLITSQLQSFYLRRSLPNLWDQRDLIILVRRSRRRNRYFLNHGSIMNMLQKAASKHDLRVWEFRDDPAPPLPEVAAMFNRAVMVVAPHGAGQTNLLFSQPGVVLVEGLCLDLEDAKINLVYRNVVHVVGGIYHGFYRPDRNCSRTTAEEFEKPVNFYLTSFFKGKGSQTVKPKSG